MDDEEWIIEDPSTAAPEPDSAPADEPSAEPVADTIVDAMEEEEEEVRLPRKDRGDRPILCKYWKRPVRLQYAYLYDYRHNYYDDVIDYLDKRQRGIHRSIPTAQTWAERALRTYNVRNKTTEDFHKREQDITLLSDIRTSSRFYRYHSKDYYTTKYMSIL